MTNAIVEKDMFPTTVGCGALAIWSLYALVVSEILKNLPVFQTLFLMFAVCFTVMSIRLTAKKRWHRVKDQPILIWIVGILGVCGSDIAYISAVKYAPPAHVDFIDYLWPFFLIIFTGFLPKERFTLQHIIAGALGFLGVFLLLSGGNGVLGLQKNYLLGYIFAFIAAVIWSGYTLINRWFKDTPTELVGLFCGVGAIITFVLHQSLETWVWPTLTQSIMVGLLGLSSGVAYLLWSYGTQKGNLKLLGVLAYFTPVISMSLLVASGKEPMSLALVFACILVVSGVFVGSMDWKSVKTFLLRARATAT